MQDDWPTPLCCERVAEERLTYSSATDPTLHGSLLPQARHSATSAALRSDRSARNGCVIVAADSSMLDGRAARSICGGAVEKNTQHILVGTGGCDRCCWSRVFRRLRFR